MKEAIGTSFVFNMVMVFVGVFIVLYVGSIAYSKGFKVRNRIIDIIEKYDGYSATNQAEIDEINGDLAAIGYQITTRKCEDRNGESSISPTNGYNYCVYQFDTSKGNYYGVTVFIKFDIPLIGSYLQIPIYGESRILFEKDKVEN